MAKSQGLKPTRAETHRSVDRYLLQQRLDELEHKIVVARAALRARLDLLRSSCKARRKLLAETIRRERAQLRVEEERARDNINAQCARTGREARAEALIEIGAQQRAKGNARKMASRSRRSKPAIEREAERLRRVPAHVLRAERAQLEEANLEPQQIPYWRKTRETWFAKERDSGGQTKALEWFQEDWAEHEDEYEADIAEKKELPEAQYTAKLIAEEARLRRQMGLPDLTEEETRVLPPKKGRARATAKPASKATTRAKAPAKRATTRAKAPTKPRAKKPATKAKKPMTETQRRRALLPDAPF